MANFAFAHDDVGSGPPVLFLHAFPYSRAMWASQWALADRFRLLLPDLPGFGDTPARADGWTVDSVADDLVGWLDGLGVTEPVAVVGLSMGGYLALALVRRHPTRLRALVLADTRAEPDSDEAKAGRAKTAELARAKGAAAVVEDALPKQLSGHTCAHRPEVVAEAQRIGAALSVEGIVAALAALRDRPDARPGLAAVAVPTLVLVGADDAITPPAAPKCWLTASRGPSCTPCRRPVTCPTWRFRTSSPPPCGASSPGYNAAPPGSRAMTEVATFGGGCFWCVEVRTAENP